MDTAQSDLLTSCFLCQPDRRLVFCHQGEGIALAGLGPIVPGYSVVGTTRHVHSLIELPPESLQKFLCFAEDVRTRLIAAYGTCLMAEHGNSPLCEFDVSRDKHCFHPHFLLFPGARDVTGRIPSGAGTLRRFATLGQAIEVGAARTEYLLLSPHPGEYVLFVPDQMLPSQFARTLMATESGRPELVSWRTTPNYEQALANAAANRLLFDGVV